MELKNSTILITGGTSGFGFEFAKQLSALGVTVIITGRNAAKLEQTRKYLPGIHTFQSDVSDVGSIQKLYADVTEQFPALNMLINNAGEMRKINLRDASNDLEDITREIAINLSGPIRMVQQFLPHLLTKKTAAIMNVTSGLALAPFPLVPVYGATKSGLRSYTKSLRAQLKTTNVRVFELVAPGAKTALGGDSFNDDIDTRSFMDAGKLIQVAIRGILNDKPEIYPGLARVIKVMSRLAPGLILNQMSKISEKAFAKTKAS